MSGAGSLEGFISAMGGERALRVDENLGDGYVRLKVSEAERRQAQQDIRHLEDIVIEMLRNSRDAGARSIFVSSSREGGIRTLTVIDDGAGIPSALQDRIFDARVTSKLDALRTDRWGVHGRGMALYSVRENVLSARVVCSAPGQGSSIQVLSDTSALSERADQSSWPIIERDDEGVPHVVNGPHNVIRTCVEFTLEERGECRVYLGSPAEIVATLVKVSQGRIDPTSLLFVDDFGTLGCVERFALASDAYDLLSIAASIGLEISERTAHRILSGQIRPLRDVLACRTHEPSGRGHARSSVNLARDQRHLHVSKDDLGEFSRAMERDFARLAERYYLSLEREPQVSVRSGKITVTFSVIQDD